MVLPPSFSRKMGEIETVEAEKIGWIDLLRGTFYLIFPHVFFENFENFGFQGPFKNKIEILGVKNPKLKNEKAIL